MTRILTEKNFIHDFTSAYNCLCELCDFVVTIMEQLEEQSSAFHLRPSVASKKQILAELAGHAESVLLDWY